MASQALHGILLESGTNELEVLVFLVAGQRYGVNVAKVREVIEPLPLTSLPQSHPAVSGVFQLRNKVIPLIHLPSCFGEKRCDDENQGKIIVMEFNDQRVGFLVDEVHYIQRANVKDVEATPDIEGMRDAPVTFVIQIDGNLVLMVDFERIVFDIAGVDPFTMGSAEPQCAAERSRRKILHAEDSHTMRDVIRANLERSGYTNIVSCMDGRAAMDTLERDLAENTELSFDLVITDIEMPKVDGLRLTRMIKDHPRMKHVPVVVFSSLVSQDNDKKCASVGADAQTTKPQLGELVGLIDGLVANANAAAPA